MMILDENKETAVNFLKLASSRNVRDAYLKFVGEGFKHHNPYFEGSAEALEAGMQENADQNPEKSLEVKHVIAEGDLVAVYSEVHHRRGDRGAAVMHIFRFENGRIVELWDVGQEVPEDSPNQYGMF
jgi:predicted SnoaL-like aldol condensation-catalyzing enzyme